MPPIQTAGNGWDKDKVVPSRVGDRDPNAERKADLKLAANTMAKIYREHMAEVEDDPDK